MAFPLILVTAAALSPIAVTTVLSFGLFATAAAFRQRQVREVRTSALPKSRLSNEMLPLHDELKLDSWQETVWSRIEKASWDSLNNGCGRFREQNEELLALLGEPGTDLRAVLKRMDEFKQESQQQHAAGRERWLSVYDTLDAGQKEKAREFLRTRLERLVNDKQVRDSETPCR